jgi:hypothetical protein
MELSKMIAELRAERTSIEEAIAVLERLAQSSQGKRRGRPPAWLSIARSAGAPQEMTPKTTKRSLSADVKKRMAEAQKKRWAAFRKAQAAEAKSA